jgi:hypothetical protein
MFRPVDAYNSYEQGGLSELSTASLIASKAVKSGDKKALGDVLTLDESVAVSNEGRAKLEQLQEAEQLAKHVPQETISTPRAERVAQLKALVAHDALKQYFDEVSSLDLAGSLMQHPLRPILE